MPSIFIRFGKCNLACPWCDTDYNRFGTMTLGDILAKVRTFSARNVIITGGEPTIQPHLEHLLDSLKAEGHFLAIETNGLKPVPPQIDYIATSPKRLYQQAYAKRHLKFAHEVRVVVDGDVRDFCAQIEDSIRADHYYLSPCDVDGRMNMLETITSWGSSTSGPAAPVAAQHPDPQAGRHRVTVLTPPCPRQSPAPRPLHADSSRRRSP